MTTDVRKCEYYEKQSENVKGRGICEVPNEMLLHYNTDDDIVIPNTKEECNVRAWHVCVLSLSLS